MLVTREKLIKFLPQTPSKTIDDAVGPLNKALERFQINTPLRISMFLAQVAHESGGLTQMEENLNYRADRLSVVFPKYFRDVDPNLYARNPEKIANRVYANRMGNGPESSGDGFRHRGRGWIQLTGKDNYNRFATAMKMNLDAAIKYLATTEGAAMSAAWFWSTNGLNEIADRRDVLASTKRINGGTIGLDDRQKKYEEALRIFT